MSSSHLDHAVHCLRQEYESIPGLRLTVWQARRFSSLPDALCDRALARLTDAGYLMRSHDGWYRRARVRVAAGGTWFAAQGPL